MVTVVESVELVHDQEAVPVGMEQPTAVAESSTNVVIGTADDEQKKASSNDDKIPINHVVVDQTPTKTTIPPASPLSPLSILLNQNNTSALFDIRNIQLVNNQQSSTEEEEEESENEEPPVSTVPIPLTTNQRMNHVKSEGNLDSFLVSRRTGNSNTNNANKRNVETLSTTPTLLRQRIMQKYKQQIEQNNFTAYTDTDTDDDMLLTNMSQHNYFRFFSWIIAKFFRVNRIVAPHGSSAQSIEELRKLERMNRTIQRDMLTTFISGFSVLGIFVIVWYNIYFNTDVLKSILEGRDSLTERFYFCMKCLFVSSIIFPLLFIAIVRNRIFEEAINPLLTNVIDRENHHRILVHQRVLQNTIEQFIMHAMSCIILSYYLHREDLRLIVFETITFLFTRILFWIGYRIHHSLRALGMVTGGLYNVFFFALALYCIVSKDILPYIFNDLLVPIFVLFSPL